MKRKFLRTIGTGLLMCSLTAVGVFAVGAQPALAADEEPQVTVADIIQANETDRIWEHYDSMLLELTEGEGEGNFLRYVEKDFRYYEDSVQKEILTPEGVYSYMEGSGYSGSVLIGQELEDFQKMHSYYGLNPDDSADEEVLDIQSEEDTLIVTSEFSTEETQELFTAEGREYLEGDTLQCIYWLEPDTLLLKKSINQISHSDGSLDEKSVCTMTYNAPCPENAAAMRARVEDKENTRVITLIDNPGTDQEATYRTTVQKGEGVQIYAGDDAVIEFYQDPECTEEYTGGADTTKDLLLYIKVSGALATEEQQVTMADIIQANETDSILEHYDSMLLEVNGEDSGFLRYVDQEFSYYEDETLKQIVTPDSIYDYTEENGYYGEIPLGDALTDFQELNSCYALNPEVSAWEAIEDIQTEGDTLIVTTSLTTEQVKEYFLSDGTEYQEGDTITCTYWLEADTLLLKKSSTLTCHSDGSTEDGISIVTYNAQCPEAASAMRARLEDKEKIRIVTIIENPGTDQEVSYHAVVQKGEGAQYYAGEDQTVEVYLDPECTEEFTGGADRDQDLTLYIKMK